MRKSPRGRSLVASQTLKITIPKAIWNAYKPSTKRATRSLNSNSPSTTHTTDQQDTIATTQSNTSAVKIQGPITGRIRPTDCRVKLWAFHYGGLKRVIKGKAMNDIEYATPCLQPTCKTCLKWHPQLIPDQDSSAQNLEREAYYWPAMEIEPISPDIDPRILDGTWRFHQSRRSSSSSTQSLTQPMMITTPELTPVKQSFTDDLQSTDASGTQRSSLSGNSPTSQWRVYLPVPLVTRAMATTSARSKWRTTPRQQYTIRLMILSHAGKRKFGELVRKREQKLKKQIYDREYKAKRKAARKQAGRRSVS